MGVSVGGTGVAVGVSVGATKLKLHACRGMLMIAIRAAIKMGLTNFVVMVFKASFRTVRDWNAIDYNVFLIARRRILVCV